MLRKLLKYDFKYIFKIWLALSVLSVPMSAFGGYCGPMSIQGSEFDGFFIFGTIISVLVIVGVAVIPFVMSLYRFYLNLYTDEGYLTFTLPVKKSDLLLSKFIFSMSTLLSGAVVGAIDGLIFAFVSSLVTGPSTDTKPVIVDSTVFPFSLAVLLIMMFSAVAGIMFVFIMISIASRFSKVGRSVFAVAVVYGGGILLSSLLVPILTLMDSSTLRWSDIIPEAMASGVTLLLLFLIAAFFAVLATLLYIVEYYILDKHLNLA